MGLTEMAAEAMTEKIVEAPREPAYAALEGLPEDMQGCLAPRITIIGDGVEAKAELLQMALAILQFIKHVDQKG